MAARNSEEGFGWVTRTFHWLMALGVLGMLGLGTAIARMEMSFSTIWLFGLHKSIGISLLLLVLLRLAWHRISPPPGPLEANVPEWQLAAARWAHRGLYLLLIIVPMTGWIASAATGIDVVIFGRIVLPPIVPASEALDHAFFSAHWVLTKCLAALIVLHIFGAFFRHFRHRDRTLVRMIAG